MFSKLFNIKSRRKLVFINLLIIAFLSLLLYFTLPTILNYPPNSIDNEFQVEIVGIKYTNQFIIVFLFLMLFFYITLSIVYGRLSFTEEKLKNPEYIKKIRKKAFNYPFIILLFELFIPSFLIAFLLFTFKTDSELIIRITAVIFTFSSVFAIFSYMISKSFFANILISTAEKANNEIVGVKVPLHRKLLIQILPLFLYSFVIILLVAISLTSQTKGEILHYFYRQELLNYFDTSIEYDVSDIQNILENINYNTEGDHGFIIKADDGEIYYSEETLNNFFIQYILNFYDDNEGYSYENYGQNIEGSLIKLNTNIGECYVGIRYFVISDSFITPFIFVSMLLVIVNILIILYIGRDFSNDINNVTDKMNQISDSDNVIYSQKLPIISNDEIGALTESFNKIQKLTQEYVTKIHDNQNMLMERERLASLGQLIGGIAHNLKTPIMSISGASEALIDLIKEYDSSIGDPEVTYADHHAIAKDMYDWVSKVKSYSEYMSDVITAVKGQAVTLSENDATSFDIDELVKRVNILMKHELKNALITLNLNINVNKTLTLSGDITSLVQVINNMISNSIQAYNGEPNKSIDLTIDKKDNNVIISIQDYGCGLPKSVQDKLFKEMITTKGKSGTGLGLFMSYSTIRAHFNGDITYETEKGKGTTFHIIIPVN